MAAVGDLAQVRVFYTFAGQAMENVFGFRALTTSATHAGLATAFQTALIKNTSGGLLYPVTNDIQSASLRVEDVYPGTTASYDLSYTAVVGNNTTDEALPPQCAFVISWRTAFSGRSFHGRTYLAGCSEAVQSAGVWTAGQLTSVTTIITQMLAVFGPAGTNTDWSFSIISRVANGSPRANPIGTQVLSGIPRQTVYTQRRRTIGVGS